MHLWARHVTDTFINPRTTTVCLGEVRPVVRLLWASALVFAVLVPRLCGFALESDSGERTVADFRGKPVSQWLRDLDSRDTGRQQAAYMAFEEIGPNEAYLVPALISGLSEVPYRFPVTQALCQIGEAAVPSLLAALKNDVTEVRLGAIEALERMGTRDVKTQHAVEECLKDTSPLVRVAAASALAKIAPHRKGEMAEVLAAVIKDPDVGEEPRLAAVASVPDMLPNVDGVIPVLIEALNGSSENVCSFARIALGTIGAPAIPELKRALAAQDARVRGLALEALGWRGPGAEEAVEVLVLALDDQDSTVRAEAAAQLCGVGPGARAAIPRLVEGAKDPDDWVRFQVVKALGRIVSDGDGDGAMSAIVSALSDRSAGVRRVAASALADATEIPKSAQGALVPALRDDDAATRVWAARALWRIGAPGQRDRLLEVLTAALQLKDEALVVCNAADTLASIGPEAKAAVPALTALLASEDAAVRLEAIDALRCIGCPDRPALIRALRDMLSPEQFIGVRAAAAEALGEFGREARAAVPELTLALQDGGPYLRVGAAGALWRASPENAPQAVTVLAKVLKRSWWADARWHAAQALADLGPAALAAEPELLSALADEHDEVRTAAARALWRAQPGKWRESGRTLVSVLQESHLWQARRDAAEALREMGPVVADLAVPALRGASRQDVYYVRRAAAEALGRMETPATRATQPSGT